MTDLDAVGLRTLPIRVPVVGGESLHSWIEAMSARYRMTVRELLPSLGLPRPRSPYALVEGVGAPALRSLEQIAGLPVGRLDEAVLDRYSPLGLAGLGGRTQGDWQTMWSRASRSGFCPRCLAENGGRWPVAWHLNWTFACTRHNVVLAVRCPACGGHPRSGEDRFDHVIDGRACCHYSPQAFEARRQPGPGMARCGAPLTDQAALELDPGHPLMACQRWIDRILAAPDEVTAAGLAVPAVEALAAAAALMRYVAAAVARPGRHPLEHLAAGPAGAGILLPPALPSGPPTVTYAAIAADPALFGTIAAVAVDVLAAPALTEAARTAAWLRAGSGRREGLRGSRWPSGLDQGATSSPLLNAIALRQRAPFMNAAWRLSYRTENAVPRRPDPAAAEAGRWPYSPGRPASVPARLVPQAAWQPVTRLLARPGDRDNGMLAAALSMALVRCGTKAEWADIAAWLVLPPRLAVIGRFWTHMDSERRLEEILACIDALAGELAVRPPPVDYARRRHIFHSLRPVTRTRLRRALHTAGLFLTDARHRWATMLLWETLTGGDVRFAGGTLAPLNPADRTKYAQFRADCGKDLREYVAVEGERLLLANRIDEPVTWEPLLENPAGPTWKSPPADFSRTLPGWNTPSRKGQLRHSAHDHTPRRGPGWPVTGEHPASSAWRQGKSSSGAAARNTVPSDLK
jgi:hypothetical protein